MTIDKADLVKRLQAAWVVLSKHGYEVRGDIGMIFHEAIIYITQQSQGRDEVLEEAQLRLRNVGWVGAADIVKGMKSPSTAPVERRSEVEAISDFALPDDQFMQKYNRPDETLKPATAQPEPQGLVDGGFDVDLDKGTLHRTSYAYEYMDWCKSQPSGSHRNDFLWLLRELDRRAAITGGK